MIYKPSLGEVLSVNYRQHPRYQGCVGHWLQNEGGGTTIYDISGYGAHGVATSPVWTVAEAGPALKFSPSTANPVTIAIKPWLELTDTFSIHLWFKTATWTTAFPGFISKRNAPSGQDWTLYHDFNTPAGIEFLVGGSRMLNKAIDPSLGKRHSLCLTRDKGGVYRVYLDGVLGDSNTNATAISTGDDLRISCLGGDKPENSMDGQVDDVRIYNRVLTPGEIVSLYQNPFLEFEEDDDDNAGIIAILDNFILNAEAGSYGITGAAATILADRLINAAAGSYEITGAAATLTKDYLIVAESGTYLVTGQVATLLADRLINAEAGEYVVTGQAATILADRLLNLEPGEYQIVGADADLIYVQVASYVLNAEPGVYAISGQAAAVLASRLLNAEPGNYVVTGQDATFLKDFIIVAESGSYGVTGAALTALVDRMINAEAGSYGVTGLAATLARPDAVSILCGTVTLRAALSGEVEVAARLSAQIDLDPALSGAAAVKGSC